MDGLSFAPPHLFARRSFERRLQLEGVNTLQPCIGTVTVPCALAETPRHERGPSDFARAFAKPPPPHPPLPVPPHPAGAGAVSPRVHYGIGSGHSPRHHTHFSLGSSIGLKAGTRMGWLPGPSGAWRIEEPPAKRF